MTLERLNPGATNQHPQIERYQQTQEQRQAGKRQRSAPELEKGPFQAGDKADISSQARDRAAVRHLVEVGRASIENQSDSPPERLAQVRERLAAGFYASAEVREAVAGRIGQLLLAQDLF